LKFSYVDKKTAVHSIHPICKILWVLAIILGCITIQNPLLLLVLFMATIPFVLIGRIFREWFLFMKFSIMLIFLIFLINSIANQNGSSEILLIKNIPILDTFRITLESLFFSLGMSIRLITTISCFSILTLTINPDDLLKTYLKLKIPYKSVLATSISTRFIPIIFDDLETLNNSLRTRAYNFDTKGFFKKIRKKAIIISPLLSNSLDRSIQLAEAMESRGFGSKGKKTMYKPIGFSRIDYVLIILPIALLFFILFIYIFNYSGFDYYPKLSSMSITLSFILVSSIMFLLVISPIVLYPLKRVIDLD